MSLLRFQKAIQELGRFLNWAFPLLYWGPKKGPYFRELPIYRLGLKGFSFVSPEPPDRTLIIRGLRHAPLKSIAQLDLSAGNMEEGRLLHNSPPCPRTRKRTEIARASEHPLAANLRFPDGYGVCQVGLWRYMPQVAEGSGFTW